MRKWLLVSLLVLLTGIVGCAPAWDDDAVVQLVFFYSDT